jgi:hypothetical protein
MYPTSTDGDDGNWLSARISVSAGAWAGSFDAHLRAEEFQAFRQQCERLYQALRGTAVFHPMEPWLQLTLTGDAKGHIELAGEATDHVGWGNRLIFNFLELDQSFLPPLVAQLREVEENFPVVGRTSGDGPNL